MAFKTQTLKQHQASTLYQQGMVKSQLRWGGHKGLPSSDTCLPDYWKEKKFLKAFSFNYPDPFLCKVHRLYFLRLRTPFTFLFHLMRGLSKPALYRSMAETSCCVHCYQWPLVEADYLLLVHKSTCQPYLESRQLISMDYRNHLLQK